MIARGPKLQRGFSFRRSPLDESRIILRSTASGETHELGELEALLLQGMTGEASIDDLVHLARSMSFMITVEDVHSLIRQARSLGMLDEYEAHFADPTFSSDDDLGEDNTSLDVSPELVKAREEFDLLDDDDPPPFELSPPSYDPADLEDAGPTRQMPIPQSVSNAAALLSGVATPPPQREHSGIITDFDGRKPAADDLLRSRSSLSAALRASPVVRLAGAPLLVLGLLTLIPVPSSVDGDATLMDPPNASLAAPRDGSLFEILVSPRATVRKGDALLRLDDGRIGARVKRAREEVEKLAREIESVRLAATPSVVRDAERDAESARLRLEDAEAEVERRQRLFQQKLDGEGPWHSAVENLELKRESLKEAQKKLDALYQARDGARAHQAEEELRRARETLALEEAQLRSYSIFSPFDGTVVSVENVRSPVKQGQKLVEVRNTGHILASIRVIGWKSDRIEVGQPVLVNLDGQADPFAGTIDQVEETPDGVTASVLLPNSDRLLWARMRGRAEIDTGRTPLVRLLVARLF